MQKRVQTERPSVRESNPGPAVMQQNHPSVTLLFFVHQQFCFSHLLPLWVSAARRFTALVEHVGPQNHTEQNRTLCPVLRSPRSLYTAQHRKTPRPKYNKLCVHKELLQRGRAVQSPGGQVAGRDQNSASEPTETTTTWWVFMMLLSVRRAQNP